MLGQAARLHHLSRVLFAMQQHQCVEHRSGRNAVWAGVQAHQYGGPVDLGAMQVAEEIAADFGVDIGLGAIKLEIGAIRLQCIVAVIITSASLDGQTDFVVQAI